MSRFLSTTLAALTLAALPAYSLAQGSAVVVQAAPPPALYEVAPPPRPGYVWSEGYWSWDGIRYVWVQGSYIQVRPGYEYAPASWVAHGGAWVFTAPRWRDYRNDPNLASTFINDPLPFPLPRPERDMTFARADVTGARASAVIPPAMPAQRDEAAYAYTWEPHPARP
jgi:hypothetical protein